jgi:alkylhydroperoxidase family enzyme
MSVPAQAFGGRIPVLRPDFMSDEQKQVYDRINRSQVPWATNAGFRVKSDDGGLLGAYNSQILSPGTNAGYLDMLDAEKKHTSLSKRVREVIILSVGAVWKSDYEIYAHSAVGRTAGLSESAIRTLAAGGLPDDLDGQEKIAQRYAKQLSLERRVDADLYAEAEQSFGLQGLADMIYLIGIYHIVCGFLNSFDVPVPAMPASHLPLAKLTTVATFPPQFFLENLVMRADHSLLITVLNRGELWYVPPVDEAPPVEPGLLFDFPKNGRGQNASGIVEVEPDVFYLASGNWYTSGECYLYRLDLRGWKPGSNVVPELVFEFPKAARSLNGMCLIAPKVLLVADSFAGLIRRVDLDADGGRPQAREWLAHVSMGYFPGALKPEQPGVNSVRFAAKTNALYYTATAKKLFMRVQVDLQTHEATGEPELIVAGRMGDDFCIDEDSEVLYLTTHRQNTIDRVSMNPARNSGFTQSVAGDPYTEELIGPTSGIWGRGAGEYGRVAYFLSDGGTASPPPDGIVRPARVLRVQF